MIMSWIYTGMLVLALLCAVLTGQGGALSAAVPEGAAAGITLAISLAGSICLWSGVGRLMERSGMTQALSRLLGPLLHLVFPGAKKDPALGRDLSANICANFLGLGNAATPMGIRAAKRMVLPDKPHLATDQLCRLIVLNTASIQLIPANVAAIRAKLGSAMPFDILPAVWVTSFCSAGLGVLAVWLLGKVWRCE